MLKRLADKHPDCVSQLTYQYRMHDNICQLSNVIVYKGKLKCANDSVAKQKMTIKGFPHDLKRATTPDNFTWLSKVIDPSNAVMFLDTDKICIDPSNSTVGSIYPLENTQSRRVGGSIINDSEASIVQSIMEGFTHSGVDPSSIGIICPFKAQLRLLDEKESFIEWKRGGLEVSTIDRFQGRDKPVIIVSFVRSNTKGKVGKLLEDFRRLNVAVTRAKYKLIMVGSYSTLHKGSDVLKTVLDCLSHDNQVIQLPSNINSPHAKYF
jgi:DNA replication ATP-dependent helicase Dna2